MRDYTREDMLAMTPQKYLADGYFDDAGNIRRELKNEFAIAAATQLLAAEVSPDELTITYEAFKLLLDAEPEITVKAFFRIVAEAMETADRVMGQTNNKGVVAWVIGCAEQVGSATDVTAFMEHFLAVLRLYTVFAASLEPPPPEE